MAERKSKCPNCLTFNLEILEILNPETSNMNARANLKCLDCKHTWEDKVTSPLTERRRLNGWIR